MNSRQKNTAALFVVLAVALSATPQTHAQSRETPRTGVIDKVGVIDGPTKQRINDVLLELEQKHLAMFKVLVIDTTHGRDIHDFAIDKAREWDMRWKDSDSGLLLVVAINDRMYRFETGESLEKWLPDTLTDDYGQDYLTPYFRQGRYGDGIYMTVLAVANRLSSQAGVPLGSGGQPQAAPQRGTKVEAAPCCAGVFPLFVMFIIFVSIFYSRRRAYRSWGGGGLLQGMLLGSLLGNMTSGGGRSSWGGFSSGGGSGFGGGFGGGGFGGGFGGGGSTGSW